MSYEATGYNPDNLSAGMFFDTFGHGQKVVNVVESALVHPTHTPDLSNIGDPVSFGDTGVGTVIGNGNSVLETDNVLVAVDGIVNILVEGHDGTNPAAIAIGDVVFLQTDGTIDVDTGGKRFGISMRVVASSATGVLSPVMLGAPAV